MTKRSVSRLGLKCLFISFLAFILSGGLFFFLYTDVTARVLEDIGESSFWGEHVQRLSDGFQEYVTENGLTAEEAREDTFWKNNHRSIHFYLTRSSHKTENSEYFESRILCSDGVLYTFITPRMSHLDNIGAAVSIAVSATVFFLILVPFIAHLIRRITHLNQEMDILTGGDLDYSIRSPGKDEVAMLGQSIEAMRLSVLGQIERENKAVSANSQLITSLSHDLRTPLTKLIGYLEILRYKRYDNPADEERYLNRAIDNARQLKSLSDKLFQSFLVSKEPGESTDAELSHGSSLLACLLADMNADLQSAGFMADFPVIEDDIDLLMPETDLRRVIDNLFSNIKKYADPDQPVSVYYKRHEKAVTLGFANDKKKDVAADSSGIGLVTIRQLMEEYGGNLDILRGTHRFIALLRFPGKTN